MTAAALDAWRAQLAHVRAAVADLAALDAAVTCADLRALAEVRRAFEQLHGRVTVAL